MDILGNEPHGQGKYELKEAPLPLVLRLWVVVLRSFALWWTTLAFPKVLSEDRHGVTVFDERVEYLPDLVLA